MRALFWSLALFSLAVGLALAAHFNTGYALLVLPKHRVELSLNFVVLVVISAVILGYWLVKISVTMFSLSSRVREYRLRRRSEKGRGAMLESLNAYFEGRFAKAEKAAARAILLGESPSLNAIVAARCAHQLRDFAKRDSYLSVAETLAIHDFDAKLITEAELLLAQRRHQEAIAVLGRLSHKHTSAQVLELKAQQQAMNWEQVLVLAEQLAKRDVLPAIEAERIVRLAHIESLKRKAYDVHSLREYWEKIPAAHKRDSDIAFFAAEGFLALNENSTASTIIEQSLEEQWDSELVGMYDRCLVEDTLKQIEYGEKWLKLHPSDAMLLLVLGKLCLRQQLWGKAESYLDASLSIEASHSAHLALADLCAKLGKGDRVKLHQEKSLELTLKQLNAISGGRHKLIV